MTTHITLVTRHVKSDNYLSKFIATTERIKMMSMIECGRWRTSLF